MSARCLRPVDSFGRWCNQPAIYMDADNCELVCEEHRPSPETPEIDYAFALCPSCDGFECVECGWTGKVKVSRS